MPSRTNLVTIRTRSHHIHLKSTIQHLNAIRIHHVLVSLWGLQLHQRERDHATVDNLSVLGNVVYLVGEKGLEEGSEPNRMASHNHVLFFHSRKGKITKLIHALQAVRVDWFVSNVQAHIRLVVKDSLKVTNLGRSIDP